MTDFETRVAGEPVTPLDGWRLEWIDPRLGTGRLIGPDATLPVVVEGTGVAWVVTLGGRRIPVSVQSWRERVLAEAEGATQAHTGPIDVKATLPGLIVAVAVSAGDEVEAGASLLTIEAMKMQNEVRAPRAGRVVEIVVASGQTVATGAALLRLA